MSANESSRRNGHELIITRTFDAPCALVWQAWIDPKHVMQWWEPDGNAYPCTGIYREVKKAERIVYDSKRDEGHPCGAGLPPRAQHIN
jgi:uncharacterized protein YndB with AHSA1/START domain